MPPARRQAAAIAQQEHGRLHVVEGWPAALRAIRPRHRPLELGPEEGRAWDERIVRTIVAHPRVMRSLPRQLRRLELVASHAYALNEIGRADFFLGSLRSFQILLPKAGAATAEEVEAFVADQLRASEEGAFFAGYNFVTCIARRPDRNP